MSTQHATQPAARPAALAPARRRLVVLGLVLLVAAVLAALGVLHAPAAHAAVEPVDPAATAGTTSTDPGSAGSPGSTGSEGSLGDEVSVSVNGVNGAPSSSVVVLIGITLLSVAPALLLMMTSFTKIFVVLALTRNALGLQGVPPNQVMAGLALFLSLFIMAPVISDVNDAGVQPYLNGEVSFSQAVEVGKAPLEEFMLAHTREADIALMTRAADADNPTDAESVPFTTLVPAFMLSELRSAFIMGFVIFIPFLVIDLVVSSSLMAMGMMMLPPVTVSLPFKLLLFVLVDGWGMIITSLVGSYTGAG